MVVESAVAMLILSKSSTKMRLTLGTVDNIALSSSSYEAVAGNHQEL
jgi:hypothetical protein